MEVVACDRILKKAGVCVDEWLEWVQLTFTFLQQLFAHRVRVIHCVIVAWSGTCQCAAMHGSNSETSVCVCAHVRMLS